MLKVAKPRLLRPFEVALRCGFSVETIRRRAKVGKIPGAVWFGSELRFDPEQIELYIKLGGIQKSLPSQDTNPSVTTKRRRNSFDHRWPSEDHPWGSEKQADQAMNVSA